MFGYACTETPELMPMPIMLAHKLVHAPPERRKSGALDYLRPDGKSQVTIRYVDGVPRAVETVVVLDPAQPRCPAPSRIRDDVIEQVIAPDDPGGPSSTSSVASSHVNPTGRFVTGGPMGDTGLTGRKIIVDTYGGFVSARRWRLLRQGSDEGRPLRLLHGAPRGHNIVAAGLAQRAQVQVAYAIGVAEPVSDHGGHVRHGEGSETQGARGAGAAALRLHAGRHHQVPGLRRPIYKKTAAYGHFGRSEPEFTWERTNRVKSARRRGE